MASTLAGLSFREFFFFKNSKLQKNQQNFGLFWPFGVFSIVAKAWTKTRTGRPLGR
jgi:hypothetical protein